MGSSVAGPIPITAGGVQPASDPVADSLALLNAWDNAKTTETALIESHESDIQQSVLGLANSAKTDPETIIAWRTQFDDLKAKYDKAHAAFEAAIDALQIQIRRAMRTNGDAFKSAYEQKLTQLKASLKVEEKQETQVERRIAALKALRDLVEDVSKTPAPAAKRAAPKRGRKGP